MKVLYYTNCDVQDLDLIPGIIASTGDSVIVATNKLTLDFIISNKIEYIVSDRSRYLITKDIIEYLPKKIINLHPSYLPWNKGYNPNYWAIKENVPFGVTLHYIDENIDTGNIVAQTRVFFDKNDTLKTTYDRLRFFMVGLFKTAWPLLRECKLPDSPQNKNEGTLHYKKDFQGILEHLPQKWDTNITEI